MSRLNQLLQNYVNMSYDELLSQANHSLSQFINTLGSAESASKICAVITAACLGVDGKLTSLESKFLNDLLDSDHSYDSNLDFVQSLSGDEACKLVDELVDSLSADAKAAVVSFCLCFLAVDETISRDEVAFVYRLID
ncbi:MAG: hypothetical protein J6L87_01835 [Clostridia bacterium]|nr:hypothetical protein [Clostridia bacterium]